MTEQQAREIVEKALSFARADHTEVQVSYSRQAATRFANNAITQHVASVDRGVSVRSAFGQQVGTTTSSEVSDESLQALVARSEAIARASAPDTEYLPPPGMQTYTPIRAYCPETAEQSHETRARAVADCLRPVVAAGLRAAGSYTTWATASAIGNSSGLFGYHTATAAHYAQTVMTDDSSGWGESWAPSVDRLEPLVAAETALSKAQAASSPGEIPPGAYTAVLEPAAVSELLGFAAWTMQAKAADEGRSCWAGREGSRVGIEGLTVRTVPADPELPGSPWIQQGLASKDVTWIENGVLRTLVYDRYWAREKGREPTGSPSNLIVDGDGATVADLVAEVDRGVLITRFWYIRFVDPMQLVLTGMTRDGLFLIEGGRVTRGLRNMRFNDSPLRMLKAIRRLGRPKVTAISGMMRVPPMTVEDFHFTSQTSF